MAKNRIGFGSDLVLNNSYIGIGTTQPSSKLDVAGDVSISGVVTASVITASTFNHLATNDINHVSLIDIAELNSGDYIELYAMNTDNDESLRVVDMNVIVSQLG